MREALGIFEGCVMGKKENHFRGIVVRALKPLRAMAVENGGCHPGTPDVHCFAGWIEVKREYEWPKRAATPLRIPTFTQQQRTWHAITYQLGGESWVLIQVARDYVLLSGRWAAQRLNEAPRAELEEHALRFWTDKKTFIAELLDYMRERATAPALRSI